MISKESLPILAQGVVAVKLVIIRIVVSIEKRFILGKHHTSLPLARLLAKFVARVWQEGDEFICIYSWLCSQ